MEAHALADAGEWRLIAGVAYYVLSELASSPAEVRQFRERSKEILHAVIERWPTGDIASQAYAGLALTADSFEEALLFRRRRVAADPSNSFALEMLAWQLAQRGEGSDYAQAAESLHRAYTALSDADAARTNLKRWHLASGAIGYYEWSDQADRAATLREQVQRESGMDIFATDVLSDGFTTDLDYVEQVFEVACWVYIISLFGSDTCLNGIETVVSAAGSSGDDSRRRRLVDVASEGMARLLVAEETQDHKERFGAVLREWIDSGGATARVFVQYSNVAPDEETWVWALENAVQLEPDNGRYRHWLAGAYLELERFDEAIEHFEIARRNLPEDFSEEILDGHIRRAEAGREQAQP